MRITMISEMKLRNVNTCLQRHGRSGPTMTEEMIYLIHTRKQRDAQIKGTSKSEIHLTNVCFKQ